MNENTTDPAVTGYAPTNALDREPTGPTASNDLRRAALVGALEIPIGAYDKRIIDWLANLDDPTVRTVVSLIRRATAAAFAAGVIQADRDAEDLADVEAETCPPWCEHHTDDEVAGERTHFGARTRVGPHEVQLVEVRRLVDGQTVDTRIFTGGDPDTCMTLDEARRLARLLWVRTGELTESSTQWAGEGEMDPRARDRRALVVALGELARRLATGQLDLTGRDGR